MTSDGQPEWLVGKYFHSFHRNGRNVERQGKIVAYLGNGDYAVELVDSLIAMNTTLRMVPRSDMYAWRFYETQDEMMDVYKKEYANLLPPNKEEMRQPR